MKTKRIGGMIVPVATPLTTDQQVDIKALVKLCDLQVRAGINVIFALGTTGEFYGLTLEQRRVVVDTVLQAVADRVPVIVGVTGDSTASALATYRACRRPGIAGYVASTPYLFDYRQEELADHFRRLAGVVEQPLILYNFPGRYRHRIDVETVAVLVQEQAASAIKDTAGDFDYLRQLLEVKRAHPNFGVFEGALQNLAQAAPLGIDGAVQAIGNLFPHECAAMWSAVTAKQWDVLGGLAGRLWDFQVAMERVTNFIAALKGGMAVRGWCGATPAAPTRAVSAPQAERLGQMLGAFLNGQKG